MADEQKTEIENTESLETKQEVEHQEPMIAQSELDKIIEKRLVRERAKFEKKFSGIDPDEARKLLEEKEAKEMEMQKQRGEFDKVLKDTVSKKEAEISQYKAELQKVRIDDALIKVASEYQAIKPEQVVNLLKNKVQLGEDGKPEIIGENNAPMFKKPLNLTRFKLVIVSISNSVSVLNLAGIGSTFIFSTIRFATLSYSLTVPSAHNV